MAKKRSSYNDLMVLALVLVTAALSITAGFFIGKDNAEAKNRYLITLDKLDKPYVAKFIIEPLPAKKFHLPSWKKK